MSASEDAVDFCFYLSSDLDLPVKVKVQGLQGCLNAKPGLAGTRERPLAVYAEAVLASQGGLLGLPCRTRWAEAGVPNDAACSWDAWLVFPIKYRDLPHDAQLAVTVWGVAEARPLEALGGATMRLFSKKGRLKDGVQTLGLTLGRPADLGWPSATPGKLPLVQRSELGRLEHLVKRYQRGELQEVPWLDDAALSAVDALRMEALDSARDSRQGAELAVELQQWPHTVLYHQAAPATRDGTGGAAAPQAGLPLHTPHTGLIVLNDPEVDRPNPVDLKVQKLARSGAAGGDLDAKPDAEEKRQIAVVLAYPPNRSLSPEDRALLWRFRWALTGESRALTRVLACVDWQDKAERRQGIALAVAWTPVDTATALELLSPAFPDEELRAQAVVVLKRAGDEELSQYLLQLSAALRYEAKDDSKLASFLLQRASRNHALGLALHWLLLTEFEDPTHGQRFQHVYERFQAHAGRAKEAIVEDVSKQMQLLTLVRHVSEELQRKGGNAARKVSYLHQMLGPLGTCSQLATAVMPCPLDAAVQLTGIVPSECAVFKSALSPLKLTFSTASAANRSQEDAQLEATTGTDVADVPESPSERHGMDARRRPDRALDKGRYTIIYKAGDDLRQDQLVLQMFTLMDRLLKDENLDLKLTPYRVLPTSAGDGMIEYVPSVSLARVLAEHRTIQRFLLLHNEDPERPGDLRGAALDTFVKSCAGYCVMTYILGIGDRHLDNLMLCPDGRLFHIDFGFILGRDPKPFPPPMKLCKEMVEVMGGADGDAYRAFRTLACEAYNILRRSSGLLLSLVHLMARASITDLKADPNKALLKLQETLRLDMDDEAAVEWMQQLLTESATALMPQIMETGHKWAQYWR
mmetsp:Transcript_20231/g.60979  ORF Transcript_20231/g.60979 Transcript_20231/m.60979 type:complete len:864 (+) Transcript_20231:256-2847(+)